MAGLPDIRFHDLLHTFTTQAIECGVDPKTLSGILGHPKPSFSLDRYTYVTSEMPKNTADRIDRLITRVEPKTNGGTSTVTEAAKALLSNQQSRRERIIAQLAFARAENNLRVKHHKQVN